jgi:WD40 repeat protein
VRLWDSTAGACKKALERHSHWVRAVAFSPDSKVLASGSYDDTVRFWDATTGACKQTLEGHSDSVLALTFSPDGKVLASASYDNTVRLWDATTGAWKHTLEGHGNRVNALAFSPDGKVLASASDDRTVWLWDVVTGAWKQTFEIDCYVASLLFSDGQYLKTDRGMLSLNSGSFGLYLHPNRDQSINAISIDNEWVTRDGHNLPWLPLDFRPSCSAVFSNMLVLGRKSGHVTFLEFVSSWHICSSIFMS